MIVIVMGVSGSGKTVIGQALAERLGCAFIEGDDYHPPGNIQKMSRGTALSDADRLPWLRRLNQQLKAHPRCVLACSALRAAYRDELTRGLTQPVRFLFLNVDRETVERRMQRRNHFFPTALLNSQYDALEEPDGDEAITLDASRSVGQIVKQAIDRLKEKRREDKAQKAEDQP